MKGLFRLFMIAVFISLNTSCDTTDTEQFSVITYNVWNGFEGEEERRDTFVKWAVQQDADVIALQELNGYTQDSLGRIAKKWGHPYAIILKEKGYPVGLTSKYPIKKVHRLIDGMHHGGLYAEINGIHFFVVHFSPFSSAKRLKEADAVISFLKGKDILNEQTIVLGDFNAFSPHDSLFYVRAGLRDRMYLKQKNNEKLRNLNDSNEIDYHVIDSFLKRDFFDSFTLFQQDFESSFPTKVFPDVTPEDYVRIDHVLVSKNLKGVCSKAELIKDSITHSLSDHYPLKTVLLLNK